MEDRKDPSVNLNGITAKLKRDMTVTAPTWVFVCAAIGALVLLGVALD